MLRGFSLILLCIFTGCQMKNEKVDLIVKDAVIYTVDSAFSVLEAIAVKNGRIYDTGSTVEIEKKYKADTILSLKGCYIYPGWNDAHAHFVAYGLSLNQVDLMGTSSVEEIIARCKAYSIKNPGKWITGRGWDQNDWVKKNFPNKYELDEAFPNIPVFLKRVDGHAAWVNSKALELSGVSGKSKIIGGNVKLKNGEPTGILIDNAIALVEKNIPEPGREEIIAGIIKAQDNCFAVGLTSLSDAGLSKDMVQLIDSLQQQGILKLRINTWLGPSESNFESFVETGIIQNDNLSVRTIKLYADGALGSRGARMIEPYSDDPGNKGLFVTDTGMLREYCTRALENNFQVATHCIGDAANRQVLHLYSELLDEHNDRRWRIEHAQIIHPDDFQIFEKYSIIPSVQPTHATSDMYWAEARIGKARLKGAYSYKTLLLQNGWIALGSDFPVEDINPLYGFYAAVARKDRSGYPGEGFRKEEALSRVEALKGMTIWAAKAAFEENYKGSLEKGKLADFVVLDEDIMTSDEARIPEIKVQQTFSGGHPVYRKTD